MNQYRIVERMTSGSFGVVFKAVRLSDNRILVLKRVPLAELDEAAKRTAMHEVELMQQLHHPHIVAHRDAFMFNGDDLCIVMDYYGGGDLAKIILDAADALEHSTAVSLLPEPHATSIDTSASDSSPRSLRQRRRVSNTVVKMDEGAVTSPHRGTQPPQGYLAESRVMLWFAEMCLAVHYLHSHRIIHRDLKTQNVFVNSSNGEVAVGDFGVARIAESISQAHAAAPSSTGTPLYMAPEILQGHSHATFKSDIWSLGCILYELLALRHPFATSDFSGLVIKISKGEYAPLPPHYSKPIGKLVERMLDRDPRRRPLIDEILCSPLVRSYLQAYLSVRVPLEPYMSQSESMLRKQLEALDVVSEMETEDTDETLTSLGSPSRHPPSDVGFHPAVVSTQKRSSSFEQRPLEELNSPSSRYERMHRTHASEALEVPSGGRLGFQDRRQGSHQRTESTPSFPQRPDYFADDGDSPRASRPEEQALPPVRRSISLDPSNARRTASSMLPFPSNVDDMRGKTIGEIEQEVVRLRRLVQQEMANLSQGAVSSHGVGSSTALPPVRLTAIASLPSGDECGPLSRRSAASVAGGSQSSNFYRAFESQHNVAGGTSAFHSKPNELSKMQRRKQLFRHCVDALGEKAFHEVYTYYNSYPPQSRDVAMVRHLVPDRTLWHLLPNVEEILHIDRDIMRM